MQLVADGIVELAEKIEIYSDEYNQYTLVYLRCGSCENKFFNLIERSWDHESVHLSIAMECIKCKNVETAFDTIKDGYDGSCIFNNEDNSKDVVKNEIIISSGNFRINYAYSLNENELFETAKIHNTNPGNLFHSISFELQEIHDSQFYSVWDAETA